MNFVELIDDLVDLFYPTLCPACEQPLVKNEDRLCLDCLWEMPFAGMSDMDDNMVEQKLWGKIPFEFATAMLYYKKGGRVQKLIYALKYHGDQEAGLKLGQLLGQELAKSKRFCSIDLVLPVPLNPRKMATRGYNQCDLIALGMEEFGFKSSLDNVIRNTDTTSQTRKGIFDRWSNVDSIFSVKRPEELKGKHVLLIDDVITTGSTLEACGQAIVMCDDVKLSIASVACAE